MTATTYPRLACGSILLAAATGAGCNAPRRTALDDHTLICATDNEPRALRWWLEHGRGPARALRLNCLAQHL